VGIAAIDERGEDAVIERELAGVGGLRRARRVPAARVRAYALHRAAGEQPHDVHLVRRLVLDRGAELLGTPRAIEPVGVIERRDHADRPIGAAFNERPGARDRRIVAVAMAHNEVHAGGARGVDHSAAFVERKGHGLLDQHVLPLFRRQPGMRRVEFVRRGHVDHLDGRVGAHFVDRPECAAAVIPAKALEGLRARIGGGDQLDARVAKRRCHDGERAAEAGHADAEPFHIMPGC
jgi:hypothetical protein